MPELSVKTKFNSPAINTVRGALKATFPLWGIVSGLIALFGIAALVVALVQSPSTLLNAGQSGVQAIFFIITCLGVTVTGLFLTRLLAINHVVVDKNGMTLPVMPDQLEHSRKYIPWSKVHKIQILEKSDSNAPPAISELPALTAVPGVIPAQLSGPTPAQKKVQSKTLMIYRESGGPIKLRLSYFEPSELEQMVLAIELWSKSIEVDGLEDLKDDLKVITSGQSELSYTDMWEDELRRRFCPTSFVPLEPNRTLKQGSLKIIRHLALGGLAAVYLCDNGEKNLVVLKEAVIPEDAQESVKQKAREMFEREARLLMKLDHPGIVKVLDYFVEDSRHYLMLEYLNGQDLRQFVRQHGPQKENTVIDWAIQIANIMKHLHEQDPPVIHRDLTPDNLVVTKDGSIVVIDFGAANEFIGTATGTLVGKQSYIAPEQFRGHAIIESDIYAFGCTLFFMLTGEEPEALSTSRPRTMKDDLSIEIDELVGSCTEMEPEDRYRTAAQLIPVLRRIAAVHAGL